MFFQLFLSGLAIAGGVMLWRAILEDSPELKTSLKRILPQTLFRAIDCPFCISYWAALVFIIPFDPLPTWTPVARFELDSYVYTFLKLILSWFALGATVIALRTVIEQLFHLSSYALALLKRTWGSGEKS